MAGPFWVAYAVKFKKLFEFEFMLRLMPEFPWAPVVVKLVKLLLVDDLR